MKKSTRKLLPALAMLLVSAVMLATASFAWFASSPTAKAESMNVTLKSDSQYLFIAAYEGTAFTADDVQAGAKNAIAGKALNPDTDKVWDTAEDKDGPIEILPVANKDLTAANAGTASTWYTKVADSAAASTSSDTTGTSVTTGNLKKYVVKYTYYVTLADGSPDANKLFISGNKITVGANSDNTKGDVYNPVSVVVVCDDTKFVEFKHNAGSWEASDTTLATSVTSADVNVIDVYVYYNGEDTTVFNNNFDKLANASISFTLEVSDS